MNLQQLIEKYPSVKNCIEVYDGIEYINPNKLKKLMNESLNRDIRNYDGFILLDSYDNDLSESQIINS